MSQILASRDLAFLHPVARIVGGPAVRNMATVSVAISLRSHPYGDLTAALLAGRSHGRRSQAVTVGATCRSPISFATAIVEPRTARLRP